MAGDADVVDFGIRALGDRIGERAAELAAPIQNAPVLMPAYAHLWSQTAPIPNADPEVALFLHGPDRSPASVQIVWRADIGEERDLRPAMGKGDEAKGVRDRLIELFKLMPPRAAEAIEVPLWAARAWLDRSEADQAGFADVAARSEDKSEAQPVAARRAFLWAGEDGARTGSVYGRALRNGDLCPRLRLRRPRAMLPRRTLRLHPRTGLHPPRKRRPRS